VIGGVFLETLTHCRCRRHRPPHELTGGIPKLSTEVLPSADQWR
jgi:hypothetical protein